MGIPIGPVEVPESEVRFVAGPSSGPGGQNVNKVETRVTLLFDLAASQALDPEQKRRIAESLASRISKQGILRVTSQRHRTQEANRKAARERFAELLSEALREEAPRRATRPSRAARRKRVEGKRRRGRLKAERREPPE